jgi:hypothetical protein
MPAFYLEWEWAVEGVSKFLETFEDEETCSGEKPDRAQLMQSIVAAKREESLRGLDGLASSEHDAEKRARLKEIREAIEDIDFEKAEILLNLYAEDFGQERGEGFDARENE